MPLPRIASLFFSALILVPAVHSTCYLPNGKMYPNWSKYSEWQPCSADISNPLSSICCAKRRSNPSGGNISDGFTSDICLPNGLCQNIQTEDNGALTYTYWRDYCTESDWKSGKCLNVCTAESARTANASLTPCDDTSNATKWCCGTNDTDCCNRNDEFVSIAATFTFSSFTAPSTSHSATTSAPSVSSSMTTTFTSSVPPSTTTSASSIPFSIWRSVSPILSSSTTPAPSSSSSRSSGSGLSTGTKIGIAVGTVIGAVALIVAYTFMCFLSRKNKAGINISKSRHQEGRVVRATPPHEGRYSHYQKQELDDSGAIIEMSGVGRRDGQQPVELA